MGYLYIYSLGFFASTVLYLLGVCFASYLSQNYYDSEVIEGDVEKLVIFGVLSWVGTTFLLILIYMLFLSWMFDILKGSITKK